MLNLVHPHAATLLLFIYPFIYYPPGLRFVSGLCVWLRSASELDQSTGLAF